MTTFSLDEFEERVSPAFVRKIQGRLQVRYFTYYCSTMISPFPLQLFHPFLNNDFTLLLFSGESYGGGEEPGDAVDGHQVLLRRPLPFQSLQYQLRRAGGESCLSPFVYDYTALLTVFHSYLVVLQFPASIVLF